MKRRIAFVILALVLFFFFVGRAKEEETPQWGVTFSQHYATDLGLDWRESYLAILDELKVKRIRLVAQWNYIEFERGNYYFKDLDWQMEQARERGVDVTLVIGMKTPRWPECHFPDWSIELDKGEQQEAILSLIEEIVLRYRKEPALIRWQVENEPFLDFGFCPWYDKKFLVKEVERVRELSDLPILMSESGELSTWFSGAKIGDIVGSTMYRQTWWHRAGGFYFRYPIPAVHYYRKALLVKWFFNKEVVAVEVQAEPWGPVPTFILDLEEQERSMNLDIFRANLRYAKSSGLKEFYLWGAEWWYWMKEVHQRDEIWQEAKQLFL